MRKRNALVALAGALALASTLGSASAHTVSRDYVAGTGDLVVLPQALLDDCTNPAPVSIGGACLIVTGHTSITRITIADASGRPVGGAYGFRTADGAAIGNDTGFCGSKTLPIGIPSSAFRMFVWVDTVLGLLDCPNALPGSATTGTITVVMFP